MKRIQSTGMINSKIINNKLMNKVLRIESSSPHKKIRGDHFSNISSSTIPTPSLTPP